MLSEASDAVSRPSRSPSPCLSDPPFNRASGHDRLFIYATRLRFCLDAWRGMSRNGRLVSICWIGETPQSALIGIACVFAFCERMKATPARDAAISSSTFAARPIWQAWALHMMWKSLSGPGQRAVVGARGCGVSRLSEQCEHGAPNGAQRAWHGRIDRLHCSSSVAQ